MNWFQTTLAIARDNPVMVWIAGFCLLAFVVVMVALISTM